MSARSVFDMVAHGGGPAGQPVDWDEVRRAARLLFDPQLWVHLQSPTGRGRGVPAADGALVEDAVRALAGGPCVYWHLHPLLPRSASARAGDHAKRRWLLIDIDRVKTPETKGLAASDEEQEAARSLALDVLDFLAGEGWPAPVQVSPGNGWHLLYRVELPNDEANRALFKFLLGSLADRFAGEDRGEIDAGLYAATAGGKLPGTWARNRAAAPGRPHRMARLAFVPPAVEVVPAELLHGLARSVGPALAKRLANKVESAALRGILGREVHEAPPPRPAAPPAGYAFHLLNFDAARRRAYAARAADNVCAEIAAAPAGRRESTLQRGAARLGQLVGSGDLEEFAAVDRLWVAACEAGLDADGNCGERHVRDTIHRNIAWGKANPRGVPEAPGSNGVNGAHHANGAAKPAPEAGQGGPVWVVTLDGRELKSGEPRSFLLPPRGTAGGPVEFEILSLTEVVSRDFPEPKWVVPGILSEGLNVLGGKPKQGKSMLALNLGMTIAGGGMALGSVRTVAGDVLYLSLEDKFRRVQSRARRMARGLDCAVTDRLKIVTSWPRLDQGGLDLLDVWFRSVQNPTLVIVDVWSAYKPTGPSRASAYDQDSNQMRAVKQFCDDWECNSLVLHHCRKGGSEDAVEEISGTLGLAGVADGIVVLRRSRSENEAKIFITGRDVPEAELALEFDPETFTWKSLGSAEQHLKGKLQTQVIQCLKGLNGQSAFTSFIAEHLNEDVNKVRVILHRLWEKRIISRQGNAWAYPGEETPPAEEREDF